MAATFRRADIFSGDVLDRTSGERPRLSYRRSPTQIAVLPIYFAAPSEYASLTRGEALGSNQEIGYRLSRYDLTPSIQFPLTKWPFLSLRSSLEWPNTYYIGRLDANGRPADDPLYRRYLVLESRIVGPIFSKVFHDGDSIGQGAMGITTGRLD